MCLARFAKVDQRFNNEPRHVTDEKYADDDRYCLEEIFFSLHYNVTISE